METRSGGTGSKVKVLHKCESESVSVMQEKCNLCNLPNQNVGVCMIKNCSSKLALLRSYILWNARYSTDWNRERWLSEALKSNIILTCVPIITIIYLPCSICIFDQLQLMLCRCIGRSILGCDVNFDNSSDGYSCCSLHILHNKLVHSPLENYLLKLAVQRPKQPLP